MLIILNIVKINLGGERMAFHLGLFNSDESNIDYNVALRNYKAASKKEKKKRKKAAKAKQEKENKKKGDPDKKAGKESVGSSSGSSSGSSNQSYADAMQQSQSRRIDPPQQFPLHVDHSTEATESPDLAKYGSAKFNPSIQVTLSTVSGTYPLVPRSFSHQIDADAETRLFADLISVQTQNDMQNDIPTATFVLGNSKDWASLLAVNDLVRIDIVSPLYANNFLTSTQWHICIYTGLISNLTRNRSWNNNQETYTVVAQGMAKIFSNIQLSTFSELQSSLTGYQLLPDDEKTGIGFKQHTSANIIKQIINRFILQNQGGVNTYDFLASQSGEDITKRTTAVNNGDVKDFMGQPMSEDQYQQYMDAVSDNNSDDDSDDSDSDNAQQQAQQQGDTALPEESWLNVPLTVDANGELPLQNLMEFYIYENLDESYPDAGPNNPFVNYNGSILQFIKDVSSKPFNEMYWDYTRGIATFVYRPTPFDPPNWKGLAIQEIAPEDILDLNIGTNDQEQAAVFKITATQGLGSTQFDGGFNGNLAPLTNLDLVHRYGYKLLQANTDYFDGNDTEVGSAQQTAGTIGADSEAMKNYTAQEAQMKYPPYTSIEDAFWLTSGRKGSSDVSIPKEAGGSAGYNAVSSAIKSSSNEHEFANKIASYGINDQQAATLWTMRNGFSQARYLQVIMPSYNPTTTNLSKNSKYLNSMKHMKAHPKKAASDLIQELGYTIGSKQAYDLVQAAIKNGGKVPEAEYNRIISGKANGGDDYTDQEDGVAGSPMSGNESVPFFFLRYTQKLFDWYADNAKFYSGTMTIQMPAYSNDVPGKSQMDLGGGFIGNRIEFYDDDSNCWWEFYCEGVSYSFSYTNGLQAVLNLTRGVPLETETESYDKRFTQPWSFWGQSTIFKGGYFGEQDLATAIQNAGSSDSGGSGSGSDSDIISTGEDIMKHCNWHYSQGQRTDMGSPGKPKKNGHADCSSFVWFVLKSCGYDVGDQPFNTGSAPHYLDKISDSDAGPGTVVISTSPEGHAAFITDKWQGNKTGILNMCAWHGYHTDYPGDVVENTFDMTFGSGFNHTCYKPKGKSKK